MSYIRITSSATITTSSNHLVAENKTLSQSMALTGNQISSPEFFSPVTMTRIVHALTFVTITMAVSTKARAVTLSYAVDKCFISSRVKNPQTNREEYVLMFADTIMRCFVVLQRYKPAIHIHRHQFAQSGASIIYFDQSLISFHLTNTDEYTANQISRD